MSQYNIEMNSFNGSSYDQLFPQTLWSNINGWENSIYTKDETNSQINTLIKEVVPTLDIAKYQHIMDLTPRSNSFNMVFPKEVRDYTSIMIIGSSLKLDGGSSIEFYLGNPNRSSLIGHMRAISSTNTNIGALVFFIGKSNNNSGYITGFYSHTDGPDSNMAYPVSIYNTSNIIYCECSSTGSVVEDGSIVVYGY